MGIQDEDWSTSGSTVHLYEKKKGQAKCVEETFVNCALLLFSPPSSEKTLNLNEAACFGKGCVTQHAHSGRRLCVCVLLFLQCGATERDKWLRRKNQRLAASRSFRCDSFCWEESEWEETVVLRLSHLLKLNKWCFSSLDAFKLLHVIYISNQRKSLPKLKWLHFIWWFHLKLQYVVHRGNGSPHVSSLLPCSFVLLPTDCTDFIC